MFWCYVLNSLKTSTKRMLPKIYCYPCGLTLSAPLVATFPLAVSLLLFCPVVYMEPTLSSFSKALNCFRFIDLFAPYSSNNLSTKDCATGPFKLRASSCEKTWESVVLMRAKEHRRSKTVQEFAESIDELYKKAPFCSTTLSLYAGKHVKFCWVLISNRDFSHDLTTSSGLCNRAFLECWTSPVPGSQITRVLRASYFPATKGGHSVCGSCSAQLVYLQIDTCLL